MDSLLRELTQMPLEELALFVAKAGKNRSPDPEAIASELQKAARESYRIRPELSSSITFVLASIQRILSALKESLKEVNKAIEKQAKGFINPLLFIKGIGPVYTAGILASIGDVSRFPSHNKLARFALVLSGRENKQVTANLRILAWSESVTNTSNTIWWKQQTHCRCTMRPSRYSTRENTRR